MNLSKLVFDPPIPETFYAIRAVCAHICLQVLKSSKAA